MTISHKSFTEVKNCLWIRSNVLKHEAGRHRTTESKSFQCNICDKKVGAFVSELCSENPWKLNIKHIIWIYY